MQIITITWLKLTILTVFIESLYKISITFAILLIFGKSTLACVTHTSYDTNIRQNLMGIKMAMYNLNYWAYKCLDNTTQKCILSSHVFFFLA